MRTNLPPETTHTHDTRQASNDANRLDTHPNTIYTHARTDNMQCCMGMDSDAGAWPHEKKEKERGEERVVLTAAEERLKMYEPPRRGT